jgi:hypothetical protein
MSGFDFRVIFRTSALLEVIVIESIYIIYSGFVLSIPIGLMELIELFLIYIYRFELFINSIEL